MEVVGKTNCERTQIEQRVKDGFRRFELMWSDKLFYQKEIDRLKSLENSMDINFISLHTPHLGLEEMKKSIDMVDHVAEELDIQYIVMHSMLIKDFPPDFLELVTGRKILENIIESNSRKIVDLMDIGFNFCLDLAHLFRCSWVENLCYFSELENILKNGSKSIKLVHFCDSNSEEDNLSFGEGIMGIDKSFKILRKYYDGSVVVEVPVDEMKRCKDYLENFFQKNRKSK